jgi:hypothetical protein
LSTFRDRLLVHLSDPAALPAFLSGTDLAAFLTADHQRRFNSEFWTVAQVVVAQGSLAGFEDPLWTRTRILGREDQNGNAPLRKTVDYSVYGTERPTWIDVDLALDTVWTVDQFPGSVDITPTTPPTFEGTANLLTVLRVDGANHPLDRAGVPLATVTVDEQGRVMTSPPDRVQLTVDPLSGALLRPGGSIEAAARFELFPRVGAGTVLGVPLGPDGQPLSNLRLDSRGQFTDMTGAPAATDPVTGLPRDGTGAPGRPSRLAIPDGGGEDFRFSFSLPVRTDRLTLALGTRLHLLVPTQVDLTEDVRAALAARAAFEQGEDYLISLDDLNNKVAHSFGLVYEADAFDGSGLDAAGIGRLGAAVGVLVLLFALP